MAVSWLAPSQSRGRISTMPAERPSASVRDRLLTRRTLIQTGGASALAAVALGDKFFARPHYVSAQAISTIATDIHQTGTEFSKGDLPADGGFSSASVQDGLTVQRGLNGVQYTSNVINLDFAM